MATLKISMACWQVASEESTRRKVSAARRFGVTTCAGGGPFEVAVTMGRLNEYLDLCADIGFVRIEAGEGFTDSGLDPTAVVSAAESRGLEVQFEMGKKHEGSFTGDVVQDLIDQGSRWLDGGAKLLVVEARECAVEVGVFDDHGALDNGLADRFVEAFGLPLTLFEAPDKYSQFSLINHFGGTVRLGNVRLEEILRVEIYRRGLHSDAFQYPNLRPSGPPTAD